MPSSIIQVLTSMEEAKVRLTMAATMHTEPMWQGLKKWTLSTLAVTQGPPATDFAASPAQMSIQLNTWRAAFVSPEHTLTVLVADDMYSSRFKLALCPMGL